MYPFEISPAGEKVGACDGGAVKFCSHRNWVGGGAYKVQRHGPNQGIAGEIEDEIADAALLHICMYVLHI